MVYVGGFEQAVCALILRSMSSMWGQVAQSILKRIDFAAIDLLIQSEEAERKPAVQLHLPCKVTEHSSIASV